MHSALGEMIEKLNWIKFLYRFEKAMLNKSKNCENYIWADTFLRLFKSDFT